jgi:hypothetical protein
MKITCDVECVADSILDENKRELFLKRFKPSQYPWGIELQTCDKWTTAQQGKIFRDFGLAAKLLETSTAAIYHIVKTNPLTRMFFEVTEWVGAKGRGKKVTRDKGLSEFTKDDCIEAIDPILDLLQMMVNSCYQEVVVINWSSKENEENQKKLGQPDYEFTGISYNGSEDTEQKIIDTFDGEEVL